MHAFAYRVFPLCDLQYEHVCVISLDILVQKIDFTVQILLTQRQVFGRLVIHHQGDAQSSLAIRKDRPADGEWPEIWFACHVGPGFQYM